MMAVCQRPSTPHTDRGGYPRPPVDMGLLLTYGAYSTDFSLYLLAQVSMSA